MASAIAFRALALSDLDDLHGWLNRPHLARFFQKVPVGRAGVEAKYEPRIRGAAPTRCHLALHRQRPFGYLQCYRIADWPEWAVLIGATNGVGVDLAIFEPDMIGRGFGRAMLSTHVHTVAFRLYPEEIRCFIAHDLENEPAIAASKAAGFRHVRDFEEDGRANALFVVERAAFDK